MPEKQRPSLATHRIRVRRFLNLLVWLLLWLSYCLGALWFGLLFGFIGSGFPGGLMESLPLTILGWSGPDWAWICGAIFGVLAFVFGEVGNPPYTLNRRPPSRPMTRLPELILMLRPRPGRPPWIGSEARQGAIYFGIAGLALGMLLDVSWFSIAVSPFGPEEWRQSLSSASSTHGPAGRSTSGGMSTSHPLAFAVFLGPPIVFALLGYLAGGFRGILTPWIPSDFK